jgi:translocation and assembly module TamB
MRNIIIQIAKLLAAGIVIILLLSCILFGLAQTDYGKDRIVRLINNSLKQRGDIGIQVSMLTGLIPFHFEIDRMAFSDNSGLWLEISKISFRLSPYELLKGRLFINEFTADSMILERLPQKDKKRVSKAAEPTSWLTMVYRIGLQRLNIARLSLGKALLGEPAEFSVKAGIEDKETDDQSEMLLRVERTDGVKGLILLDAKIKGAEPYLHVEARIEESENGLIGRLLRIKTPVYLTLGGDGYIRDWHGRLSAKADELAEIDTEIVLRLLDNARVDLTGTAELNAGKIPDNLIGLLDPKMSFAIQSRIIGKRELVFDSIDLTSGNASININGMLDMDRLTSEGRFTINLDDLSSLESLIKKRYSGTLLAEGSFGGALFKPRVDVKLNIKELETEGLRADEFTGDFFVLFQERDDPNVSIPVPLLGGEGDITNMRITAVSSVLFMEKRLKWSIDMEGPVNDLIRFNELEVSSGDLSILISGIVNHSEKKGSLELSLTAFTLDRFYSLFPLDLPGSATLEAKLEADAIAGSFNSDIRGSLIMREGLGPSVLKLIGPELEYSGRIELSQARHIEFSALEVNSETAGLTVSGSYDLSKKEIDASLGLEAHQINLLSPFIKRNIEGSAHVNGLIGGTTEMMRLQADVESENLSIEGLSFRRIFASIDVSGRYLRSEGDVFLKIEHPNYRLNWTSGFKWEDHVLVLDNIFMEGAGARLSGTLTADVGEALFNGELQAECDDISSLEPFLEEKIEGSAEIEVKFRSIVGDNMIDLSLLGKDIISRFGRSDKLVVNAEISGPFRDPSISTNIFLSGFQRDNLVFESMEFIAQGNLRKVDFTSTAAGRAGEDMLMETTGSIFFSPGEQAIAINRFQGEFGGVPVNLLSPCNISRSTGTIEIKDTELSFATGYLEGSGNLSENSLNFLLDFKEIPINAIPFAPFREFDGIAAGSLMLSGEPWRPEARSDFIIRNLKIHNSQYDNLPPLKLESRSDLKSGRLRSDLSIDAMTGIPFKANIDIPMILSLVPFSCAFPKDDGLKGNLSGEINLLNIAAIASMDDQRLMGRIEIDLDLEGTIGAPVIVGRAHLKEGGYENIRTGTVLKNIEAEILSEPPRIFINSITASDDLGGLLSGQGWIDAISENDFPYNISFIFKKIALARNDSVTLSVGGQITVSGSLFSNSISGNLGIEKAEIRIPDRLSTDITELEVIEVNRVGFFEEEKQRVTSRKTDIKLDLSLESPGRVYINGRGLSSEWKGNLVIKGTTTEPLINGRLSVLRGNYNFLGKRFNLNEGFIDFDGKYPPSPYLDITGEAKTRDITAVVKLAGTFQNLEVKLDSNPSVPSDEILAQLLFGRNVSQITPLQAIQLGNAVNAMRGKNTYDFMGRTREVLGVDQLEVRQAGTNMEDPTISAGKYLSDKVYFEVEKGIGAESGKAAVKWEITPHLTVDTEVGENAETGAGINWKWDY